MIGHERQKCVGLRILNRGGRRDSKSARPLCDLRALCGFSLPAPTSGDEVEKLGRALSGGGKARLVMAEMLFDPLNLLVLGG